MIREQRRLLIKIPHATAFARNRRRINATTSTEN
jgi:hypothetical protein